MNAKVNMKRRKRIGRPIRSAMPKMTEERMLEGVKRFGLSYNDGEGVPEGGSDTLKKKVIMHFRSHITDFFALQICCRADHTE